jgi:nucleoside-diphosphate-sugar epimerase
VIIVTGASGVIGRALMARLHAERLPCVVLDRDMLARSVPLTDAVLRKPSVLVHLAAVVPQPPAIPDDETSAARTHDMDSRVLEAVKQWDCHAVYASGCSLYTKGDALPKREEEAGAEHRPSSAYLAAKQQGERNFLASGRATVLRISAPVGEGLPRATAVGRFMEAAKAGGELEVWGGGQREQNYVDVADLADALFRALIVRPGELINIAADQPITMLELARQIIQACGRGVVRMAGKPDPRDGQSARYSNQKAADLLGWRPMTPMRVSLERLSRVAL